MTFQKMVDDAQSYFPNLKIKIKEDSLFMIIISKILFFNKYFMTDYTTTIGETIYYPRNIINKDISSMIILLHEIVHIKDSHKYSKFIFNLMYLSPQILSLIFLPLIFISVKIFLPLTILFLLPIPSYFRMYLERRAYIATLYAISKLSAKFSYKPLLASQQNIFLHQFKTSAYYFMWPFKALLDKHFEQSIELIKNNQRPFEDPIFDIIDDLILKN